VKPKWLALLLVVSLAANLVEVGLYVRAEWRRRREMDRFFRWVQTGAAQWHLRVVVESFVPEMRWLEGRALRWKAELNRQNYLPQPDSARDRLALDSIASTARQQYDLLYRSRRALPSIKDHKLRQRMEKRWRMQMGLDD